MMLTIDELERLARYRAGELLLEERCALEHELATRPELALGLADLEALDRAVGMLPRELLSAPEQSNLAERALESEARSQSQSQVRSRSRRWQWAAVSLAASLALGVAWSLLRTPQTQLEVVAGTAVALGRTWVAGEHIVNPGRVMIGEVGAAVVRFPSGTALLMAPESEVDFSDSPAPELRRGAIVVQGDLQLTAAAHRVHVSGEAVISMGPLAGGIRETRNHLMWEDLVKPGRFRIATASAVTAAALAVYVIQGTTRVKAESESDAEGAVDIVAPGQWVSQPRGTAAAAVASTEDASVAIGESASAAPPVEEAMSEADGVLEVRVLTADAKPVSGAQVVLYWRGRRDPSTEEQAWPVAGAVETNAGGEARLPARPGTYLLSVRSSAWPRTTKEVHRPLGESVTRVEVRLAGALRLEGFAENERTHQPVAPATVRVIPPDAPEQEAISAVVDARGRFVFEGLSAGPWRVEGQAPGLGRATAVMAHVPSNEPVRLLFLPSAYIEGRVVLPDGGAAAGADVLLSSSNTVSIDSSTSHSGAFSVEVRSGEWQVSARHGSLLGRARSSVLVNAGATGSAGTIVLGRGATLSGHVMSAKRPVVGAFVVLTPHGGSGEVASVPSGPSGTGSVQPNGNAKSRVVTDATGAYSIDVAPGIYDLEAEAPEHAPDVVRGLRVDNDTVADFQLDGLGSIQGVVRSTDGSSVAGALLRLEQGSGSPPPALRLGEDGRFEIEKVLPESWLVSVRREGELMGSSAVVTVHPRAASTVELTLQPTATLEGRVVWRCPGPPQAVDIIFIAVSSSGMSPPARGELTLAPGATSFEAQLQPGSYRLRAMAADRRCLDAAGQKRSMPEPISLHSGRRTEVTVQLEAEGPTTLDVEVVDSSGVPAPEAWVSAKSASAPRVFDRGEADVDGRWASHVSWPSVPLSVTATLGSRTGHIELAAGTRRATVRLEAPGAIALTIEGAAPGSRTTVRLFAEGYSDEFVTTSPELFVDSVPSGTVRVMVQSEELASEGGDVRVLPGAVVKKTITLSAGGGSIVGRLVDAAGSPTSGRVTLVAALAGRVRATVQVDETGRFEFSDVSQGVYMLEGQSPGHSAEDLVNVGNGERADVGDLGAEDRRKDELPTDGGR